MNKLVGVAAALGCWLAFRGDANACGNEAMLKTDPAIATVAEAERLVDGGNPQDAVQWVKLANPGFALAKPGAAPLSDRALSVLARAAARSGGERYLGHTSASPSLEERQAAIGWAATTLRALRDVKPNDPVAATNLAEALASLPAQRNEALKILEPLEKSDLLPSAYGYAALAKLRAQTAAEKPAFLRAPLAALTSSKRLLAVDRCTRMTKDAAICTGGEATPVKPNQGVRQAVLAQNANADEYNRRYFGAGSGRR